MVFSSLTFLLVFLPVTAAMYYLPVFLFSHSLKKNGKENLIYNHKNGVLCAASLVFYAWGEPVNILLMLFSVLFNYFAGLAIDSANDERKKKRQLVAAILFNTSLLAFFKYSGFVTDNINALTGIKTALPEIALPIGISFYTFQILSYDIDVYRKNVPAQKNLLDFTLYISMFPQLIAGPIVQYSMIADLMRKREESFLSCYEGINLFVIGLAKKAVLANAAGSAYNDFFAVSQPTALAAWCGMLFYSFQIYFDFSGYSDMARGLGLMFGFTFPENFDYPYTADSITDFWRRWHITLSSWFRDYVYIPLGGSRRSAARNIFNLLVVWSLTGLWHGAAWNFVLWGVYYFILLVLEKYVFKKLLKKIPSPIKHILTLLLVLFGWVLFSAESAGDIVTTLAAMFGSGGLYDSSALYTLTSSLALLPALAVFSTPILRLKDRSGHRRMNRGLKLIVTVVLLALSIITLVSDSYNPFLYFRF